MTKIFILAGILIAVLYFNIKSLKDITEKIENNTENILVINSLIKDKLELKDKEIEIKKYEIAKIQANYIAFNGTACGLCHLDEKNMFPYRDKELNLQNYIKTVRAGIPEVGMPSYVNKPSKGINEITDGELKRQFKVLKNLENFKGYGYANEQKP